MKDIFGLYQFSVLLLLTLVAIAFKVTKDREDHLGGVSEQASEYFDGSTKPMTRYPYFNPPASVSVITYRELKDRRSRYVATKSSE